MNVLSSCWFRRAALGALFVVVSIRALGQTPLSTALTYQGQLKQNGQPHNGNVDLVFRLFDVPTGGVPLGAQTLNGTPVSTGLFTVQLNAGGEFGASAFDGNERWLEIEVNGTPLAPRQPITAMPYALGLVPGITINGGANGLSSISIFHDDLFTNAIYAYQNATDGTAIYGESGAGTSGKGIWGLTSDGIGVYGQSFGGVGVAGSSTNGRGVYGEGKTNGIHGVTYGTAVDGTAGVYGVHSSRGNAGYLGTYSNAVAGVGASSGAVGVLGVAGPNGIGVYGWDGSYPGARAAQFVGDVSVVGNLTKSSGSFKIDHPLDPENKFLYHSFVESPDMMNIYNGNVVTDEAGYATIALPEWFEALNRDFRYQLTVIDSGDSDAWVMAKVVREIENNQFTIRTSQPGVKVSWQVTGIRHDAYAEAYRIPVEQDKPAQVRGSYLHPLEHGRAPEQSIEDAHRKMLRPAAPQLPPPPGRGMRATGR